jgi:hypothetical protein
MYKPKKRLRAGAVGLLVAAVTLGVISVAGATGPTEGTSVPDSAVPIGTITPGTPFSSGQAIDVVIPANSIFSPTQNILIVECSAPNGVIPTLPSACNGDTINGPSIEPNADGSIDFQAATGSLYQVFATPDPAIGDTPTSPACGETAATECILYIGNNQNDFTKAHVWSQPFFIAPTPGDTGANPGDGSAPTTATPQPTSLSTSLAGGGQSGASISVPTGTAVSDTATLSGTNASTATGTVTYNVYSDSGCTTLAPGGGGSAETITTPGALPPSAMVTLSASGTYDWGVSYSGDSSNQSSSSTCGTAGEVETVTAVTATPQPTSLSTSLAGGGQSGASISVPTGTAVSDTATLSGTNASTATGTVTYNVYSDSGCTTLAPGGGGSAETITTPGALPPSAMVTLSASGTYDWGVSYSGDSSNQSSSSTCGTAGEVETVTAVTATPQPTSLSTSLAGGRRTNGRDFRWQGRIVAVVAGAYVTDTARLSGTNAATATGTVTYTLYTRQTVTKNHHRLWHWVVLGTAGTVTVTAGQVPKSYAVTVPDGVYEWQAVYSGDSANQPSASRFGSETEIVVPSSECETGQKTSKPSCDPSLK